MPMEIDLGPQAERFRDELRQWLEANRPEGFGDADERTAMTLGRAWRAWGDRMHEAGYLCVSWPEEFVEPVETMAEAALALCTGTPDTLTGRIAYSRALLDELGIEPPAPG